LWSRLPKRYQLLTSAQLGKKIKCNTRGILPAEFIYKSLQGLDANEVGDARGKKEAKNR
jgi:hypothetical protein